MRLLSLLLATLATPVIASGPGANSRFSIGMVITTGMLVGTLFTLFVLPALYLPLRKARSTGNATP